ncbi:MAG: 50S ribosomal protein L13 [Planctomycetota bacterium]
MKTYMAKKDDIEKRWYHIDADSLVLGRLAVACAKLLMGKTKPQYTPHVDTGDFVIVTNAAQIKVTGNKSNNKTYKHYTGYPGGLREIPYKKMLEKQPTKVIRLAVQRMLPKNLLGTKMLKKLKVFAGESHTHISQQPKTITLADVH